MNKDKLIELIRFTACEIEPKEISIECAESILIDFEKQLSIHDVSQQRKLLEWLSNEDYFNIPKDEINEILEDWKTYSSNCG